MASLGDEEHTQMDDSKFESNESDSSSDDGASGDEAEPTPVQWLATGRERRSTAGNRMKSMIAAEELDDELELLFAEAEDDAGFTDVEDDASDVQMDSSSDDEDAQENGDEMEGEKELERQARESRQAARKRKAQEAIPVKFRKKVKINTPSAATGTSSATTPTPRPKKKSERTSWLPSPADMPTRASKRGTTMLSKEQLHRQMIEREVKRLKQVEAMERKAKKMEALKKPPMTQAERLAEAAIVEKKNAKSLNSWEEAEKQREEERRARLAALNNRTLDGPVVTFWSGMGEWIDGKLRHVGKIVTIEDKPAKKKRVSNVAHETTHEESVEGSKKNNDSQTKESTRGELDATSAQTPSSVPKTGSEGSVSKPESSSETPQATEATGGSSPSATKSGLERAASSQPALPAATEKAVDTSTATPQKTLPSSLPAKPTTQPSLQLPVSKPPESEPPEMKPPDIRPLASNTYTTSMFAPPQQTGLMKPPEMKPPNKFLAPPAGVSKGGLSMPMIGYHSTPNASSNVLAPPSTTQRHSPLSMPQTNSVPPTPTPSQPPKPTTPSVQKAPAQKRRQPSTPLGNQKLAHTNAARVQPLAPSPPPSPPANGKATRNCIVLQNFDEDAIKEKAVQNHILFGQEMCKLAKPTPAPRCVITNHPARYRDPKTGLPYYNGYAYKEIQKLRHGDYKWSRLVGAWLGNGAQAASGVPARFLDPKAPGPLKTQPAPVEAHEDGNEDARDAQPAETPASAPQLATALSTSNRSASSNSSYEYGSLYEHKARISSANDTAANTPYTNCSSWSSTYGRRSYLNDINNTGPGLSAER
ncbi:hypothetical protein DL762_007721 [Monosporascus cannonballus]|uniref:Vps72/YL1 C-terminal domain-containing protein n=1 Tax=Monosporascus cannonballus TaxID=155416 RepID=A0ABY0GYI9_9PEZI|nr:hypothetical protein DL762_007721 [Monosporascus cannonballus]RYO92512.1 hypothetical protein DL763_004641 [Monosporascus cannonballus]